MTIRERLNGLSRMCYAGVPASALGLLDRIGGPHFCASLAPDRAVARAQIAVQWRCTAREVPCPIWWERLMWLQAGQSLRRP